MVHRNVAAEDVTEEYRDIDIRLKAAKSVQERLTQLLQKAQKVEDSLAIERELDRVTVEIDRLEGRMKFLRDRAAFSTITVVFQPKAQENVSQSPFKMPTPVAEPARAREVDVVMNAWTRALVICAALASLTACGRPFVAATPAGFVDLGDKYPEDEYRATTADGVILSARAFDNEPKAPSTSGRARSSAACARWAATPCSKNIAAAASTASLPLRSRRGQGNPSSTTSALYVSDDKIFLLEAGGPKAEVQAAAANRRLHAGFPQVSVNSGSTRLRGPSSRWSRRRAPSGTRRGRRAR